MSPDPRSGIYRPSGRFSVLALVSIPVLAVPVAAVTAAIYAYAILYIPLVGYFTFVLTAFFGLLVGLAVSKGVHLGKARNTQLAAVLGFAAGLVALYLSWVVWIFALARRGGAEIPLVGLALHPDALWELIRGVNAEGAWSIKGWTPTGTVLWVFWTIEALLVVLIPTFIGAGAAASPFCEQCGSWCKETKGVFIGSDAPREELVERLKAQDMAYLASLGPAKAGAARRIRYDLHVCGCGAVATLTAALLTTTVEKGKEKEDSTEFLDKVLLRRDTVAALQGLGRTRSAAAARSAG